jgi:hypothetical protein
MRGIKYFVGIAAFAALLAGCAFTSPNGTHVIYNPNHKGTVPCITQAGCIGPDNVWYPYQAEVPTAAPAPPAGAKFRLAAGVWRTDGTAPGAAACSWSRLDANGVVITRSLSPSGARYVEVADTDSEFVTSGCLPWHRYDGSQQVGRTLVPCATPVNCTTTYHYDPGDYFINNTQDAFPGVGFLQFDPTNLGACQWERVSNWRDEASSTIIFGDGHGDHSQNGHLGPGYILLPAGEGIRLVGCGMTWTYGFPS